MGTNSRSVVLELSDASLKGILDIPEGASGIVAFAHGLPITWLELAHDA